MPLEPVWREFFEAAALIEAIDPLGLLTPEVIAPRNLSDLIAARKDGHLVGAERIQLPDDGNGRVRTATDVKPNANFVAGDAMKSASSEVHRIATAAASGSLARAAQEVVNHRRSLLRFLGGPFRDSIAAQRLFTVYLHPPPKYSYGSSSLFHGYEIVNRVKVSWAQHSVVRH